MGSFIDLCGKRFGNLTVLSLAPRRKGRTVWNVLCDCGKTSIVRGDQMQRGTTVACGCVGTRRLKEHRDKHGLCGSPAHVAWVSMRARCSNKAHASYKDYGGRGIEVCKRWGKFENFLADMGQPPANMSIDRWPDNDGNYEPSNCRWTTDAEQARNKRSTVEITWMGESMCLTDWARRLEINEATLYARVVRQRWPIERAFTRPVTKFGDRQPRGEI